MGCAACGLPAQDTSMDSASAHANKDVILRLPICISFRLENWFIGYVHAVP
jgi:hypothetical protein